MKLTTVEQIQKRVGLLPAPRDLKVIDYIDAHARRWLSFSNFAFIAFGRVGDVQLTAAGGEAGFVSVSDAGCLLVLLESFDNDDAVKCGLSFGGLFMISGMEETLRVNGKVSGVVDGQATLDVEECYLHCAKSLRRSEFWLPKLVEQSHCEISNYMKRAKFLVLASINKSGQIDVSPKGDPEQFLIQEHDDVVCFADRPGNRRIDSFRNIVEQPEVSVIALIPGCKDILELKGTAELCIDEALIQHFEIQGKKPKLITKIAPTLKQLRSSSAIEHSVLWPAKEKPRALKPSDIFKAHIKLSKDSSLKATVARAAVSLPGAMEKGLELDYKNNMY